jgi:hypothetical protein
VSPEPLGALAGDEDAIPLGVAGVAGALVGLAGAAVLAASLGRRA